MKASQSLLLVSNACNYTCPDIDRGQMYQIFAPSTHRRRYQWWVKTSPCLSLRTLLLPLSPRQTWLHLAHRTMARPTKSTLYPHSRSGSTSQCGSMSRESMSTWMDPGMGLQPLPVSCSKESASVCRYWTHWTYKCWHLSFNRSFLNPHLTSTFLV